MLQSQIARSNRNALKSCYNGIVSGHVDLRSMTWVQQTAVARRTFFQQSRPQTLKQSNNIRLIRVDNSVKQAQDMMKSIEHREAVDRKSDISAKSTGKVKKTLWQKVKEEAVHYWHGMRLLGLEVRISSRLSYKLLQGSKLTRREDRQLKRTTQDIFRLVPFAVFLIVPFMELLLPVALKLFPNMLPSTFENKKLEEEKKRKLVKVRIEMARFLQETISESGTVSDQKTDSDDPTRAQEFANFFRKVRMTGEQASTEDLLKIACKFEDELTLDNLSRPQLVSICRYMNVNAFGTDNFLRFQIRHRMRQLKMDDKVIQQEGIDNLTILELNSACAARGIRTIGNSPDRLRDELEQWLALHLEHRVPSTLLILSRAFSYTDVNVTTEDALRATFNSLPDNLVNEAELHLLETLGASTYKQKLDVLEQQEELIEDESEQEEKEEKAREAKKDSEPKETKDNNSEQADDLSKKEQNDLHDALAELHTKVNNLEQRAQFNEIKFHHEDYKDLIEELKVATHNQPTQATQRLGKRLEKMLNTIDKELDALEKKSAKEDIEEQQSNKGV